MLYSPQPPAKTAMTQALPKACTVQHHHVPRGAPLRKDSPATSSVARSKHGASLAPEASGKPHMVLPLICPLLHKGEFAISTVWGLAGPGCEQGAACLHTWSVTGSPEVKDRLITAKSGIPARYKCNNAFVYLRPFTTQKSHRSPGAAHKINLPHWSATEKGGQRQARKTRTWWPTSGQFPLPQQHACRQGLSFRGFRQKTPNAAENYSPVSEMPLQEGHMAVGPQFPPFEPLLLKDKRCNTCNFSRFNEIRLWCSTSCPAHFLKGRAMSCTPGGRAFG